MQATLSAPGTGAAAPKPAATPQPTQAQATAQQQMPVQPQHDMTLTIEQLDTLREGIRVAMSRRLESGLVPYQGQWLPPNVVEDKLRAERRASWVHLGQLIALAVVGTAFSLLMFGVLRALL